jgi:SAM-dependent methyltransferase
VARHTSQPLPQGFPFVRISDMPQSEKFVPTGSARSFGYRLLWSCANAFQKAANGCLYLAVGLLRQEDLRKASLVRWRDFGLSVDDSDIGLEQWERRLYSDFLRPSDRVLLIGCGTGRDLLGLLELGYDVTGLEQAPELVDLARTHLARRGMTATVLGGHIEVVDFDKRYDAVIFSPGVYSCLHQSASRVATLERIRMCLSDTGRILISYYRFIPRSPLSEALIRVSAWLARADWRLEAGDSFSRDHVVGRALRYEHVFRPGEVAHECAAAQLRVLWDEPVWSEFHCAVAVPALAAPG